MPQYTDENLIDRFGDNIATEPKSDPCHVECMIRAEKQKG
jgi:hypothetical protein